MSPIVASTLLAMLFAAPPSEAADDPPRRGAAKHEATSKRSSSARVLPLRRLRLYEAGVGYFERTGAIDGRNDAELPLPAGHVDDALKTLVVLDDAAGRVRVSGVRFASSIGEGMARALAGLPLTDEGELDHGTVLNSLVGLDVEVARGRGAPLRGRVLDVLGPFTPVWEQDAKRASEDASVEPRWTVILVGEDGRVTRLSSEEIQGVTPLDREVAERLRLAAAALAERSAQQPKPLAVGVAGSGKVRIGYVAEAPLWRTSHRLVFRGDRGARPGAAGESRATLQSWALVHNDTDEDWRDVSIELVSGKPTSFVFPLAAPRYAHRELATPEHELPSVPQMAVATADAMWGDHLEGVEIGHSYGAGGIGISGVGYGGGGSASGSLGLGRIGVAGSGEAAPTLGDLAEFARADIEQGSTLFAYHVRVPVDVAAHHSALVPLVESDVDAERITWIGLDNVAAAGVRMVNDTKQTLPEGTLAIYEGGGFVGETAIDRLRPGERRFLMHGQDLDVEISRNTETVSRNVHDVGWANENLVTYDLVLTRHTARVTVHGEDPRTLVVALPVARGAEIDETAELDWDHESSTPLLVVPEVSAGELERSLVAREVTTRTTTLASLTPAQLDLLIDDNGLPEAARAILRDARDDVAALEQLREETQRRGEEMERRKAEAARLRENVAALGTAHDTRAGRKLAERLLTSETRLAELELERVEADDAMVAATEAARVALSPLAALPRRATKAKTASAVSAAN
jgi:hypothetical protein